MDKNELRRRFEALSVESRGAYASYVRSNQDLWRALVRSYLWWHECQQMPDLLDELYAEHGLQVKSKNDNAPNFGPLLRIIFDRVKWQYENERITFWKWGCALNAIHVQHSDNLLRYRSKPEAKLFQYVIDAGGIDGLTKKENVDLDEPEEEPKVLPPTRSKRTKTLVHEEAKIKKAVRERAQNGLQGAKGIGTATTKLPVRVGEDGLIAVLARREPNGRITILGSSNKQSAIDQVTEHLLANDLMHLSPNIRVIAEVVRSQAYPAISMPTDPAKRVAWYRAVLLDNSPLKTSDFLPDGTKRKREHLKAPSKLLIRGLHGDIVLSGSKAALSVVTICRPTSSLISKGDQVFLRVMERSVIERMLDTGEIHLVRSEPKTGLKRSDPNAKHLYELALENSIGIRSKTLHFYDAKKKAGMLTGFQAGFDFDAWRPHWTFRAQPVWFAKLREEMLDRWFVTLGAGKQPNRPNNLIMQAIVTASSVTLVFNIQNDDLAPQRKLAADVKFTGKKSSYKTQHLSKDLAPVLFNLADVHSDGAIEVSGSDQALVFSYKNDLGVFKIAVPTAERKKNKAIRNSTAFNEITYG